MEVGARIMQQINLSTSLAIARFLSTALRDTMSPLDTHLFSLLIVALTYICGEEHVLCLLSRRLAILLMVERLRPLLLDSIHGPTAIPSLMVDAGIVSALAVVPRRWKETAEGGVLVSSIQYMFADFLLFAARWREARTTLLVVSLALGCGANWGLRWGAAVYGMLLEISCMGLITLVLTLLTDFQGGADATLLRLLLLLTLVHFAAAAPLAPALESYLLVTVASMLQGMVASDRWVWCAFLALLVEVLKAWIGLRSWTTQTAILVLVGLAVTEALAYIQHLAMFDTFLALKTTAIVLQFGLHELARLTFTGTRP